MKKIKFGIIGLGSMGRNHLNALNSLKEAEIVTLAAKKSIKEGRIIHI